jgi:hypothetical protein
MMEPLKGRLAELVAREGDAVLPPQGAKARHWAAVSAAFGPIGPPPSAGATAGAEGAAAGTAVAKGSALLKIVGGTALAAAVVTGVWASRSGDRDIETAAIHEAEDADTILEPEDAPAIVEPEPEPASAPEPEPAQSHRAPAPVEPRAAAASRSAKPSADAPDPPRGLAEEIALVESLRRAVARRDYATAKALAARHRREFAKGSLVPDRLDLEATAHCGAGDRDRGRALAEELERRWPEAPVSDRLTTACRDASESAP